MVMPFCALGVIAHTQTPTYRALCAVSSIASGCRAESAARREVSGYL